MTLLFSVLTAISLYFHSWIPLTALIVVVVMLWIAVAIARDSEMTKRPNPLRRPVPVPTPTIDASRDDAGKAPVNPFPDKESTWSE